MLSGTVCLNYGTQMSKDITLFIADNRNHKLAKFAIEKTLSSIDCKEIITYSDRPIIEGAKLIPLRKEINLYDYSSIVLKQLWSHIETDHVLIIQYDGMAIRRDLWDDAWLKYDYIGAIWPWPIKGQNMGNGGFSLRSRKLIDACRDNKIQLGGESGQNEDSAICVEFRNHLEEKYGIQYAPKEVAGKFSTENYFQEPSFGFHGIWNAAKFMDKTDVEYIMNHIQDYTWKDASKTQMWIRILMERGFDDLVMQTINILNGIKK